MTGVCARCGHEIDMDGADGGGGLTRAWEGREEGYRDYHGLCRDLTIRERDSQPRERDGQARERSRPRRPGRPSAAASMNEKEMI